MSLGNPFDQAERWDVSLQKMLEEGNYVTRIVEAADGTAKSSQNPQIELRFEEVNGKGAIRAWESYHEEFLRRVASLYDAAGRKVPQEGEFDPADHCRIAQRALDRLVGATVGIVVRDKEDVDPSTGQSRKRTRVEGYVEPARIAGSSADGSPANGDATYESPAFAGDDVGF